MRKKGWEIMKKFFIVLSVIAAVLIVSGCSATWEGVKDDSSRAWQNTKEGIHNATAD